jgi:hypothetical protein
MGMMNFKIKTAVIVLFLMSSLIVFFAAFFPSEVMTSKWVMIAGQKKDIQIKLEDIQDWKNWNLLLTAATQVSITKESDQLMVGDKIKWISIPGSQNEILVTEKTDDGIAIDIKLNGQDPIHSGFSIAQRKDSVQVVWFIVEKLNWYPWEKIYGMMASDMKGPALQASLDNFKASQ